jgi:C4-dicarboxylate-specific signal transduction histidine kinase
MGVPVEVLQSLAQGLPVSTRVGTGGEQGQGLGLGLVQEHLRRLGGRLELERLAGGGTEARIWLKRA